MDDQRSTHIDEKALRPTSQISRRTILRASLGLAGAAFLAACGGTATPTTGRRAGALDCTVDRRLGCALDRRFGGTVDRCLRRTVGGRYRLCRWRCHRDSRHRRGDTGRFE